MREVFRLGLVLYAAAAAASQPNVQPLDLTGVWTVQGTAVGVRQSAASVTGTLLQPPGCSISQLFTATLGGTAQGSQLTGTINFCRGKSPPGCPTPLPSSFIARMQGTAQQNSIVLMYEPENIEVVTNRITGNVTRCSASPAGSLSQRLVLSRCAQSSTDCGCQQGAIDILKRVRDGKIVYRKYYQAAIASGAGPTFNDVNTWVDGQAQAAGDLGYTQTGGVDLKFHGCGDNEPASRCARMEVIPKCAPSSAGPASLDEMCRRHEEGHAKDLQRAFQQLKRGEWNDARFSDYAEGKSSRRDDVARLVQSEIDQYNGDISFLDAEIARLEKQRAQKCP